MIRPNEPEGEPDSSARWYITHLYQVDNYPCEVDITYNLQGNNSMEIKFARILSQQTNSRKVWRRAFYSDCSFGKNIAVNVPPTILDLLELHKSTFVSIRP